MSGIINQVGAKSGIISGTAPPPTGNLPAGAVTLSGTTGLDYEEGTWTPSIGGNSSLSNSQGTYRRIGKMLFATVYITVVSRGTGEERKIFGLPFTSAASTGSFHLSYYNNTDSNINYIAGYIYQANYITFYANSSPSTTIGTVNVLTDNTTVQGNIVYELP